MDDRAAETGAASTEEQPGGGATATEEEAGSAAPVSRTGANGRAPANDGSGGILAEEGQRAAAAIAETIAALGLPARPVDLRPLPFEGTWGVATSVCFGLANDAVMADLAAAGALEGLSKKEAKRLAAERVRERVVTLAEQVAAAVAVREPGFARVEAANGYVNVSFDANAMAARLIGEVVRAGDRYGAGTPLAESVMVEHSQPNTHKAFHIGHFRNSCLGVSLGKILRAAGYRTQDANYIGDIGMHVVKCLWCYERFHPGQEPADPAARGRWLGEVYAEADARLNFRKDVLEFLLLLSREDQQFVAAIDRMLKYLWRKQTEGEDIAYLLGRVVGAQPIKDDLLRQPDVMIKFWPIVGDQLREAVANPKPWVPPHEGAPEPTTTPAERLATWEKLAEHMAEWWLEVPAWRDEVRHTFARWEAREPAFVSLWEETRAWSLADFRRIFAELGAEFDVWFFESEVEEEGRQIVQDLLATGIAEISEGLPVVKIDEKLGLETPTYRTLPILRSDGTTLYSTKDLALTKRKFEQFGVDRAIWVVDVRQSLYFQQVFKILELWGFAQAKQAYHLGYEMVRLPEGVISSRKGNVPVYDDVRDAVVARARQIVEEKNPELTPAAKAAVAWQVAIGSLKYAMLARDNNKVVTFDLEEALSFEGHAAPYIQYAHARACRILEHAGVTPGSLAEATADLSFGEGGPAARELGLLQAISALPQEVRQAAAEYRPLVIANYVYELAKRFNDFYHACPVLPSPEPTRTARLALVAATAQALRNGLDLLGIAAPAAM